MKEITLDARIKHLPELLAFVDRELEAHDCSIKAQTQMDIAVDEIFTNIASYAYPGAEGTATIRIRIDGGMVEVTFEDSGVPYNPLEKPDPDVSLSASERQVGGLGIFLVKKTMDEMRYVYEKGKNILTLRKRM